MRTRIFILGGVSFEIIVPSKKCRFQNDPVNWQ
jgi:hypothetical protein